MMVAGCRFIMTSSRSSADWMVKACHFRQPPTVHSGVRPRWRRTSTATVPPTILARTRTVRIRSSVSIDNDGIDESDKYHVDHSWVIVKLKDINDNTPRFKKPHIEAAVYENADVGKNLGTFKAVDIDKGGKSKITYSINRATDRKRQFAIDQEGTVTIQRELDREAMAKHSLEILATDDGVPPRTASAILTVLVKDINDNAPVFAEDYRPILLENSPPSKIIEISAVDRDDVTLGCCVSGKYVERFYLLPNELLLSIQHHRTVQFAVINEKLIFQLTDDGIELAVQAVYQDQPTYPNIPGVR